MLAGPACALSGVLAVHPAVPVACLHACLAAHPFLPACLPRCPPLPACLPASLPTPACPPCLPADVVVVTATRDGMNLTPYEYVVCRQGPAGTSNDGGGAAGAAAAAAVAHLPEKRHSMLVVSEFVGCSPSLSGAIRVNPWSIEAVSCGPAPPCLRPASPASAHSSAVHASLFSCIVVLPRQFSLVCCRHCCWSLLPQVRDAIYAAIRLPLVDRHIRHEKHWKYVSNHTVQFWAKVGGLSVQLFV